MFISSFYPHFIEWGFLLFKVLGIDKQKLDKYRFNIK